MLTGVQGTEIAICPHCITAERFRITVRGDSGFAREQLMSWCEQHRRDHRASMTATVLEDCPGNFTGLALTENSESKRIKEIQAGHRKKGDIVWTKAGGAHKWLSGICG